MILPGQNGKGCTYRPVDDKKYGKEYDRIFGKKKKKTCNHCQQCCHYMIEGKNTLCKFAKDGRCSVYHTRLGRIAAPGIVCKMRSENPANFPGCPYNTPVRKQTSTIRSRWF
jgi:hypothetical protein